MKTVDQHQLYNSYRRHFDTMQLFLSHSIHMVPSHIAGSDPPKNKQQKIIIKKKYSFV